MEREREMFPIGLLVTPEQIEPHILSTADSLYYNRTKGSNTATCRHRLQSSNNVREIDASLQETSYNTAVSNELIKLF